MKAIPKWLTPQDELTDRQLDQGLRMVTRDGVYTQIMTVFTGGPFLVAFALLLNASNLVIGLISSLAAMSQILQIPTIYLVDSTAHRKALMVFVLTVGRLLWIPLALLPWILPEGLRIPVLLGLLFVTSALGTIAGLAWNSWMRDFIPEDILGSYMGKRMAISTFVGAVLSLAAGFGVDLLKKEHAEIAVYSGYFLVGAVAGLLSVSALARTPEPRMDRRPHARIWKAVFEPFQDGNFRRLLVFLGSWNFSVNLAAPFFTVYMLKRLHLDMSLIIAFGVAGQMVNVAFFRLWGRLADRFSNKSVLTEAGPMFIATFIIWPFTDATGGMGMAVTLLLLIHVLSGISTAGVSLCTNNIALKLAPRGKATSYLAARSLVAGAAATVGPLLGGALGNWFEGEHLLVTFGWASSALGTAGNAPTLNIRGLDFLFILAFVFGLYSLHRLVVVQEEGAVEKGVVLTEFNGELRRAVRDISNVAGLRDLVYFPFAHLMRLIGERRMRRRHRPIVHEEEGEE